MQVTEEGITDLSWTAVDASGNTATGTRTIRIDRTAPALHLPTPIARPAGADGTVVVNYTAWATDANGTPSVSCTPASGTAFAVGNTTVQCTSTDVAGNSASGQFLVSVTEPLDVFASIANYLARTGWNGSESWGRQVRLPAGFDQNLITLDQRRSLEEWNRLGVTLADGGALPASGVSASLAQPAGRGGAAYLVNDNYRTILRWNRSLYFATAVGHLADRLGGP